MRGCTFAYAANTAFMVGLEACVGLGVGLAVGLVVGFAVGLVVGRGVGFVVGRGVALGVAVAARACPRCTIGLTVPSRGVATLVGVRVGFARLWGVGVGFF